VVYMTKIQHYFQAEKQESLVFVIVGISALILGLYFLLNGSSKLLNGVSWPLIFVAFIQIVVGTFIFFRSPNDEKRVSNFAENSPKNIRNIEVPRMEKVMTQFKLYRYIEMGLMVMGLILFLLASPTGFWRGVGLGIIIQAGIMLLADSFAENRGQHYLAYLKDQF
jgi:uncharacterized membrane protein